MTAPPAESQSPPSASAPVAPSAAHDVGFPQRIIRIVAGVMLSYAIFEIVQTLSYQLLQQGSRAPLRSVERALQFANLGARMLLAVAAAGMLKWRPWSRSAMICWTVLVVAGQFASHAYWFVAYASTMSTATTQMRTINQPVWQMMLWQLLWWIGQSFFPLLMWLILRQPEVANQFARVRGGGFEVVPFAQTAPDHITPPRP